MIWILIAIIALLVVGATVGGAVGGTLGRKKDAFQKPVSAAATVTVTATTSILAPASAQPSSQCPSINLQNYTSNVTSLTYTVVCMESLIPLTHV